MNRNYAIFAFILGLLAAVWVAIGYIGGSLLALAVSLVITAVYLVGGSVRDLLVGRERQIRQNVRILVFELLFYYIRIVRLFYNIVCQF